MNSYGRLPTNERLIPDTTDNQTLSMVVTVLYLKEIYFRPTVLIKHMTNIDRHNIWLFTK